MLKDLTVVLPDRPGALAEVGLALGRAGVNIIGFCAFEVAGGGIANVLVEDAETAGNILQAAGLPVQLAQDVAVVEVANHPGALGEIAKRVADAGVSLSLSYLTADGRLVLGTEDPKDLERARQAL
jgi:hypothetical protein